MLDPGCLIDDDGQAYLTFDGGGSTTQTDNARIIKLNSDMISVNGSASVVPAPNFFEASYIHKYNGRYYFSYESIPNVGMDIYYGVGASPMSGYSWKGRVMNSPYNSNNEQAAFFPYQGLWYVVYHNRYVSNGDTYHRNVCLDRIAYNSDGTIQTVTCTQDGLTQLKKVNPYNKVEAETMADDSGIETDVTFDTGGGMKVISLDSGNWIRVRGVDFTSTAAHSINTRVYANATGGAMEVRIDSTTGTRLGTVSIPNTSGAWTTVTTSISSVTGVHDIYFKVTGAFGGFNWWQFSH